MYLIPFYHIGAPSDESVDGGLGLQLIITRSFDPVCSHTLQSLKESTGALARQRGNTRRVTLPPNPRNTRYSHQYSETQLNHLEYGLKGSCTDCRYPLSLLKAKPFKILRTSATYNM